MGLLGLMAFQLPILINKNTSLSKIISSFKTITTKKIIEILNIHGNTEKDGNVGVSATINLIEKYNSMWQKSFYDHVIRDEKDLQRTREYIYNNPQQWELDTLNPKKDHKYKNWLVAKKAK
jgi:REP element-mobilizing transposase RayT